ncbi:hypothetical protein V6N13_102928 [Hibiscus sabdariffa]|uniref:Uncharacterized protein n=1 Tax=Hibiscus sabdariffa TaxID=183260 RepID=A0ABR2D8B4_9ROSI
MGAEGDSSESRPGGNGGEEGVMVNIRCSNGKKFTVRTSFGSTVGSFKAVLAQNCGVPADQQRLIYKGRILKDDQTLQSYGLQADHTVHMVRGFAPSSSTTPAATTNVATPNPMPRVPISFGPFGSNDRVELNFGSRDGAGLGELSFGSNDGAGLGELSFGSNDGAGLGASLFPGLNPLGGNGGFGLFGSGLPEFEQVQQQLTQNPQVMREIMSTPAIQSLMNNPELMRTLIMSNPQMREIIDRNPELGHILNDPSILRQTLEAARNPELMREMMRNTDSAMSNIEASPEGFNMLRRMYENVQEPLINATTMAGTNVNSPGSNPFAALLGNQGNSQARGSPNSTSTTGSETTQGQTSPNTNPLPNPWSNNAGGGAAQINIAAGSNPAGDARTPGIGGPGGLGLPEMPHMLNGMPDASQLTQLLQNPAVSQVMRSVASNPQYMNQRQCRDLAQAGATTGAPGTRSLELLMNMFGGLGAVPLEELYATQLSQLREMGFYDTEENIRALRATAGNVHAAVERLLRNSGL